MNQEKTQEKIHPEGLTESQERLADLLFETEIQAPVGRRRQLPDGTFEFYKVIRKTHPIDFSQHPEEFTLKSHEHHPNAPLTPFFINLRNLPSEVLNQIGLVLAEVKIREKPDFCTGIPSAGIPIAQAYSKFSGIELINIFDKVQEESRRRIVASGQNNKGGKIRLIDDTVTKADTKLEAIKEAEGLGFEVIDILVVVDREEGGVKQLAKAGYKLYVVFKISQLLKYYLRTGKINQARFDQVTSYLAGS